MTANTTPRIPLTAQTKRYLHDKYPDPLLGELKLQYYMEAAELYAQDAAQLQGELSAIRAETREECARVCKKEAMLYRANRIACEAAGNRIGADSDIHGEMGCDMCAQAIRALPDAKGQTKAVERNFPEIEPREKCSVCGAFGPDRAFEKHCSNAKCPASTAPGREEPR